MLLRLAANAVLLRLAGIAVLLRLGGAATCAVLLAFQRGEAAHSTMAVAVEPSTAPVVNKHEVRRAQHAAVRLVLLTR